MFPFKVPQDRSLALGGNQLWNFECMNHIRLLLAPILSSLVPVEDHTTPSLQDIQGKQMRNESKMSALATLLQKMRGVPFPEGRLAEPGASTGCCITTSSPTDAILVRSGTKEVEIKPSEVNRLEPGAAQINTEEDLDPLHPTPNSRDRKPKTSPTRVPSFKFPQPDP